MLNALVHRDYFLSQSVYVELRPDRVEVTSPGALVGGVTPANILRHPPVRRNPLLADALDQAGLVNRAGMGVDRIYEELLGLGKGPPRYASDEATVRLTLPTATHAAFARFVAEERRAERLLDLDDLILLRTAVDRGPLDRWSAAAALQTREEDAADRLAALRRRGYLAARGRGRGTAYPLASPYATLLRGAPPAAEGAPLDADTARMRIQAELAERGRLTNAEVRHLTGLSRAEALRLMRALRAEGRAEAVGRGRAAHYVPGPALGRKGSRRSR